MKAMRGRGTRTGKYRSKLEARVAKHLKDHGCPFEYESRTLFYISPAKMKRYIPDLLLLNSGIFLEVKGLLTLEDRKKMILVKKTYPELDIRFIFQRAKNTISKKSKTTYADWSDKHGFPWAELHVPAQWMKWPCTKEEKVQMAKAIQAITKELAIQRYEKYYKEL